jgi:hypothetical protein
VLRAAAGSAQNAHSRQQRGSIIGVELKAYRRRRFCLYLSLSNAHRVSGVCHAAALFLFSLQNK